MQFADSLIQFSSFAVTLEDNFARSVIGLLTIFLTILATFPKFFFCAFRTKDLILFRVLSHFCGSLKVFPNWVMSYFQD